MPLIYPFDSLQITLILITFCIFLNHVTCDIYIYYKKRHQPTVNTSFNFGVLRVICIVIYSDVLGCYNFKVVFLKLVTEDDTY